MDFGLDWTLDDARYVTGDAWRAVVQDPTNKQLSKKLADASRMYTNSLYVLNEHCLPELANYRRSLVEHKPKAAQEELLDTLYVAYCINMQKSPFRNFFHFFGID
jgi:hypothetical protein